MTLEELRVTDKNLYNQIEKIDLENLRINNNGDVIGTLVIKKENQETIKIRGNYKGYHENIYLRKNFGFELIAKDYLTDWEEMDYIQNPYL